MYGDHKSMMATLNYKQMMSTKSRQDWYIHGCRDL